MNLSVVAAVITDGEKFLVTRRRRGVHLAGFWEFPGGKIDPGETHTAALQREIREELGARVEVGDLLLETTHRYPDREVTLYFYRCELGDAPRPVLGQEMQWVRRDELAALSFPPADDELIRLLAATDAR